MSSAPVNPEIAEKLQANCTEPGIERNCLVCKAAIFLEERGKWKDRFLLVTQCCLYIFTVKQVEKTKKPKKTDKMKPETLSLFDLTEVNVDSTEKADEIVIKFRSQKEKDLSYRFKLSQTGSLQQNLKTQYKNLVWNVNSQQLGTNSPLLAEVIAGTRRVNNRRPDNILELRYVAWCAAKDVAVEPKVLSLLSNYTRSEKNGKKVMVLDQLAEVNTWSQVLFCLSLEPSLRNVVLDRFAPANLGNILESMIAQQGPWDSLDLRNYDENVVLKPLRMRRSVFNHLNVVRIHNCSCEFLNEFLKQAKPAAYSLRTLVLDNIKFNEKAAQQFIGSLESCQFVSNLDTLAFVECTCDKRSFKEFAIECLQTADGLTSFCIEKCGVDVCETLVDIARSNSPSLQRIYLRENEGKTVIGHDDVVLQSGILSLDVGGTKWTAKSLASFLSEVCKRSRRAPLALSIDSAQLDVPWTDVFRAIPMESLNPVVTELNFANNEMNAKSMELFLRFLDTQTPKFSLLPVRLQHLNVSHCLKTEPLVNSLCQFFSMRELWGLEICGSRPTLSFAQIPNLYSLNIGENDFEQTCVNTLLKFLRESSTIAEVGVDSIKFPDIPLMMSFYKDLVGISSILAFKCPTEMFSKFGKYSETQAVRASMRSKRRYSSTQDRLQLFLSLSGDFSTRVAKTIEISESTDKDHVSSPLFERTFHNPIPSLFSLATVTAVDTGVDPVASMVTEFVATSGKHGIVPPTAAPSDPPDGPLRLPAIFSTLESKHEMDDSYSLPFDPDSSEISKLSVEVAETMQKSQGQVSGTGNWNAWKDMKKFAMFTPLDIHD